MLYHMQDIIQINMVSWSFFLVQKRAKRPKHKLHNNSTGFRNPSIIIIWNMHILSMGHTSWKNLTNLQRCKRKLSTDPIFPMNPYNESIDNPFRRCEVSIGIWCSLGYDFSFTSSLSLVLKNG